MEPLLYSFENISLTQADSDSSLSLEDKATTFSKRRTPSEKKELRNNKRIEAETKKRLESLIELEVNYSKKHGLPLYQNQTLVECLNNIDKTLRSLILFSKQQEASLCSMESGVRDITKHLISFYQLGYSLKGKRNVKYLTVYTSKVSAIPIWDSKTIENIQTHPTGVQFNSSSVHKTIVHFHRNWVKTHPSTEFKNFDDVNFVTSQPSHPRSGVPKPGEVVGLHAPPLDSSHIGYQLLCNMGWNPDSAALGEDPDNTSPKPIQVVFPRGRAGIGFTS